MKVVRTAQADEDLIGIWVYIAERNPSAADQILDTLDQRCQHLDRHPLSGVARDDILPGIRHLIAGRYLTLYRIADDTIDILRVLHGRRQIDRPDVG